MPTATSLFEALRQSSEAIAGNIDTLKSFLEKEALPSTYTSDIEQVDKATCNLKKLIENLKEPLPEKSTEEIESYVSRLRHDMRTPINAIRGYSEVILEETEGQTDLQKPFLDIVRITDEILSNIVQVIPSVWNA
ncbi:MAG: hypothetical protein LBJ70_02190 [Holosporales bacterium]|jgi:signal transduction histidine kinase|nr:hypothetical protein [Holosporales bacterium]